MLAVGILNYQKYATFHLRVAMIVAIRLKMSAGRIRFLRALTREQ